MTIPNRYRRAFEYRVAKGDQGARNVASKASVRLAHSDYPDIFEDYLDISRRRNRNPTAIAKLQVHLIDDLVLQERYVKHYRDRKEELAGELARCPSGETNRQAAADLEFCEEQIFFHRMFAQCLRSIGDGVAWRALSYDRAVLRTLAGKAHKQQIGAEGTAQELVEWSSHFDSREGIAVLNSITNWLAFGDVTVIKNDGSVELVEVKSSKTKSSRTIRQKREMQELVTLFSEGQGSAEGKQVEIRRLDVFPENGLDAVSLLLEAAAEKGWCAKRISNCCYVEAFDFNKVDSLESLKAQSDDARKIALSDWHARRDFVTRRMSNELLQFTPNCAPLTIFPFPARFCIDLLTGIKMFVSHLNMSAVAREFEQHGWTVRKTTEQLVKDQDPEAMLIVAKGGFVAHLPHGDVMRLQMETLRPQVLIRAAEELRKQGPGSREYGLTAYNREAEIWK